MIENSRMALGCGSLACIGQVRDRLVTFLADTHERIIPDIMEWELTQCDINRDVQVSDWLQVAGLKIQVKHLDHLSRIYTKSVGKDTVCRVEENKHPEKKPAIEFINDVFNPAERFDMIDKIGCKCKLYSRHWKACASSAGAP
jgi:hypothetical protein